MNVSVANLIADFPTLPLPQGGVSPSVLLVEDDDRQRVQLARLLGEQGYRVHAVNSAGAAIGTFKPDIDLLITDIDLGAGMTGLDLARIMGVLRPDLPIIMLSARAPAIADRDKLVYLRKPCTSGRILHAVRQLAPIDG